MVPRGTRAYGRLMSITIVRSPARPRLPLRLGRSMAVGLALVAAAALAVATLSLTTGFGTAPTPVELASLPSCAARELPADRAAYNEWADTLLDTARTLGADYVPPDLAAVQGQPRRVRLRSFVIPDLHALLDAGIAAGETITVASAYRSFADQEATFRNLEKEYGEEAARLSAALPGHSEHQLGTTVDLDGGSEWLGANAWRFGFVLSYPTDRSPAWTCYKPEPWHFRYFGRDRAADIHASGLSPREWLWLRFKGGL
jgi:zinc D-Ala-D-Ala carboxypeptidase